MFDADLAHERDYVAGLYARLDELREEKRSQLAQVRRAGAVGTMQNVSERDAFAALYEDRLAQLDAVDDRLVFGRLDLDSGEAQYIGRIGLTTEDLQRLMVDWRAPEAGHFYQATAFDRQGVRRRRHLILQGREVKAIEDDVLDAGMLADNECSGRGRAAGGPELKAHRPDVRHRRHHPVRAGPDHPLLAFPAPSWSRADRAPARPPSHCTAPPTCSTRTATAQVRRRAAGGPVVVLHEIHRTCPAFARRDGRCDGERRAADAGHPRHRRTQADVAAIKGRLDMAEVVANAVANRQRTPAEDRVLEVDGRKLVLTPRQVRRARERARCTASRTTRPA